MALDSAIAGLAGCISIVYLNLKSLSADDWTENVQLEAAKLKAMYIAYLKDAALRLDKLEVEATKGARTFVSEADTFRSGYLVDARREDGEIERIVNRLQNSLWSYRTKVWMDNAPEDPIDILHPEIVFEELLGYEFRQVNSLGQHLTTEGMSEVAGLLDKNRKLVMISTQFSHDTQNFTAVHELGHAIMHKGMVLHRDRPIDGSRKHQRTGQEREADKFAVYFLMPAKSVKNVFEQLFSIEKFLINQETAFALRQLDANAFRESCGDLRGLTRYLAACDFFNRPFKSMSQRFRVSVETMAIRLEELELVKY